MAIWRRLRSWHCLPWTPQSRARDVCMPALRPCRWFASSHLCTLFTSGECSRLVECECARDATEDCIFVGDDRFVAFELRCCTTCYLHLYSLRSRQAFR